jgi:hypothetical protein
MPNILRLTTLAVLALAGSSFPAFAGDKSFEQPHYKSLALDWCLDYATGCGKPAADAWCVTQGYESSSHFSKWENTGEPTRIISTGKICDEEGCDGFTEISCHKGDGYSDEDKEPVHYVNPMAGKRRLDWCFSWAAECGKPAADFYCQSQGHNHSVDFKKDDNIYKTRILHTGQKCTDPECDGFKYIDCE